MRGKFAQRYMEARDRRYGAGRAMCLVMPPSMIADGGDDSDELARAGIDPEALGYLGIEERRRILREAGLNPDEFDF